LIVLQDSGALVIGGLMDSGAISACMDTTSFCQLIEHFYPE